MKICSKCKTEKPFSDFYKKSASKTGHRADCKDCLRTENNKIKHKEWLAKNEDRLADCERAKKYVSNFDSEKKLTLIQYKKEWYQKHRLKGKIKERHRQRNESDSMYKLRRAYRARIGTFLRKSGRSKSFSTNDVVGASFEVVIAHLEERFLSGMDWRNHGLYGWHIDHIIPLSVAKTEEELIKLFHYTNLQPLWAKDNLSKGAKIF